MRTTLDIDEDLLHVARQLAEQRGQTMGQVISALARQALERRSRRRVRNGVELLTPKPGNEKPHLELVNRLRDE